MPNALVEGRRSVEGASSPSPVGDARRVFGNCMDASRSRSVPIQHGQPEASKHLTGATLLFVQRCRSARSLLSPRG
jgi:hypothetical protein